MGGHRRGGYSDRLAGQGVSAGQVSLSTTLMALPPASRLTIAGGRLGQVGGSAFEALEAPDQLRFENLDE
jgi:hypothetical protein